MSTVIIDASKCENADCGECVDMCPMEKCTLCEVCVDMCPNDCITIKDE